MENNIWRIILKVSLNNSQNYKPLILKEYLNNKKYWQNNLI